MKIALIIIIVYLVVCLPIAMLVGRICRLNDAPENHNDKCQNQ